jgi:hypothetical protein
MQFANRAGGPVFVHFWFDTDGGVVFYFIDEAPVRESRGKMMFPTGALFSAFGLYGSHVETIIYGAIKLLPNVGVYNSYKSGLFFNKFSTNLRENALIECSVEAFELVSVNRWVRDVFCSVKCSTFIRKNRREAAN